MVGTWQLLTQPGRVPRERMEGTSRSHTDATQQTRSSLDSYSSTEEIFANRGRLGTGHSTYNENNEKVDEEDQDETKGDSETEIDKTMETETELGKPNLGATFYQCRTAREAKLTETIFDLTRGLKTNDKYQRIGVMDRAGDKMVTEIYHGARANRYQNGNSTEVNQGITSSYDPATLMCLVCDKEHKVTDGLYEGQPATLVFTDQNFMSALKGDSTCCMGIFRLESCSLVELTDMVVEVLEGVSLRPGTVILLGSASHLHRVGVSIYARDWVTCISRLEQKWGGVQICPVIPILSGECPSEIAREVTELGAWLIDVYKGSPRSVSDAWAALVGILSTLATGGGTSHDQAEYTIPLPSSLANNGAWKEQKFRANNPRVRTIPMMDRDATDGLLRVLLMTLNRDFMTGLNPETLLSTGNEKREDAKENTTHLILIGASHLKRTIPHLRRMGYEVIDITCPGRAVSAACVDEILNQLKGIEVPMNTVVVLDMFGNSSFRWEQEDGTLSTAVKIGGGYHLPGPVTVCNDTTFVKLVNIVMPLVSGAAGLRKVFVPPLPRYVFGPCCGEGAHCVNLKEENYAMTHLGRTEHLRHLLKAELHKQGVTKHWVMEGWRDIVGVENSTRKEDITSLRHVTGSDNVHFTREGYENLASSIHSTVTEKVQISAARPVTGPGTGKRASYFWRGFVSPVGSARPRFSAGAYNASKRGRPHPYRGGRGRNK